MSVSLTMIPVALALRVVMGKEKFDNWIASMEVVKETSFKNEHELISTVKKCGYDAERWGTSIKTHINGEKNFFFWELRDNQWVAVFSKYGNEVILQKFMKDLEQKANRSIFTNNSNTSRVVEEKWQTQTFPTNFKDLELLKQVLTSNEIPYQEVSFGLRCQLESGVLTFSQPSENSVITVEVSLAQNMQSVFKQMSLLDEDYKTYMQERSYLNVLERAEQKGLVVEKEEILADHSIVLTLSVQR